MIDDKEIEKWNFLSWYCTYATADDIEKARMINNPAMERLINEYSFEVEMINMSNNLHTKLF